MRFSGNLISLPSDVLQFGLHIKLDLNTIGIVFIIDAGFFCTRNEWNFYEKWSFVKHNSKKCQFYITTEHFDVMCEWSELN